MNRDRGPSDRVEPNVDFLDTGNLIPNQTEELKSHQASGVAQSFEIALAAVVELLPDRMILSGIKAHDLACDKRSQALGKCEKIGRF